MANTLQLDIRCAQCGYNLRTMPVKGSCPECRGSVIPSIELAMEGYWSKELPRAVLGLNLLVWTNWVGVVLILVSGAIFTMDMHVAWLVSLGLIGVVILVHAVGAWILTRASPGRRHTPNEIGVRISAVVIAIGLLDFLGSLMGTSWLVFEPFRHFVWYAFLAAPVLYAYLAGRQLKVICLSIGDQAMATWCLGTTLLFTIGYLFLIGAGLFNMIPWQHWFAIDQTKLDMIFESTACIGVLLTVPLFFIMTVLLLVLGKRLIIGYRREAHWI